MEMESVRSIFKLILEHKRYFMVLILKMGLIFYYAGEVNVNAKIFYTYIPLILYIFKTFYSKVSLNVDFLRTRKPCTIGPKI